MSDQPKQNRSLSEISHLFLSSVRDRQTGGAPRPVRRGPGMAPVTEANKDVSIDLTPEEFAEVFGAADAAAEAAEKTPHVTAIISAHLNGTQHDRVREYARHLASTGQRIGLLEVDTYEFRLMCFDCGTPATSTEVEFGADTFEPRRMAEAIDEMSWDMDRWLLVLPNPRTPEARALIREVDHWVMLSTCDHDGVVSCYRTLKGLSDMHRPTLSLGLLDAHDQTQAARVFRKLAGVCEQFLHWPLTAEAPIEPAEHVAEHVVMYCRPTRDKAQLATAPQWQITADFLARMKSGSAAQEAPVTMNETTHTPATTTPVSAPKMTARPTTPVMMDPSPALSSPRTASSAVASHASRHLADVVMSAAPGASNQNYSADREFGKELPVAAPSAKRPTFPTAASTPSATSENDGASSVSDVIDLPVGAGEAADAESIIASIIRSASGELIECPVRPPMCSESRLTIDRDRQLTLIAVAGQGFGELRSIAQAYRWLLENRSLVAMALPQFAIDALRSPRLRLLVDHADVSAELLQPMLQSGNVSVQAYRKVRWGAKMGLILEAA